METKVALFKNQTEDGASSEISWSGGTPVFFVTGVLDGGSIQAQGTVYGSTESIGDAITEAGIYSADTPIPEKTGISCVVSGSGLSSDITVVLMDV